MFTASVPTVFASPGTALTSTTTITAKFCNNFFNTEIGKEKGGETREKEKD